MKIVLQRVTQASVTVDGQVIGKIGQGFLVLLGVCDTDTEAIADKMVDKLCKLRIFQDDQGKTNLSLADVGGELLVVSQFTLYATAERQQAQLCQGGSSRHGQPALRVCGRECKGYVNRVEHGEFGADMKVGAVKRRPFTLVT